MQIFAGSESVPVIGQALSILASQQLATINDENIDLVPPDAIVLAATGPNARFPSRFLRMLPSDPHARLRELETRQLEIPQSVLEIPNLILVRPSRTTEDGRYEGSELSPFRESLFNLAGIKRLSRKRDRVRRTRSRHDWGLQPYLVC